MRIVILGNSGSGKSTLAAALAAAADAATLDLDTIAWEPDRQAVPRAEELARNDVRAFCQRHEHWVVEGCYANLGEAAFVYAPKLIFLNPGLDACLANALARPWEPHKYASREQQDANLRFLLAWIEEYYTRTGPMSLAGHRECFASYSGPKRELQQRPAGPGVEPELLAWAR